MKIILCKCRMLSFIVHRCLVNLQVVGETIWNSSASHILLVVGKLWQTKSILFIIDKKPHEKMSISFWIIGCINCPVLVDFQLRFTCYCFSSQVSQELSEAILTMVTNANMILNKARQAPPAPKTNLPPTLPNLPPTQSIGVGIVIDCVVTFAKCKMY